MLLVVRCQDLSVLKADFINYAKVKQKTAYLHFSLQKYGLVSGSFRRGVRMLSISPQLQIYKKLNLI